jgi:uncharacterized protein YcfL
MGINTLIRLINVLFALHWYRRHGLSLKKQLTVIASVALAYHSFVYCLMA